jgi:hypothetical protein
MRSKISAAVVARARWREREGKGMSEKMGDATSSYQHLPGL